MRLDHLARVAAAVCLGLLAACATGPAPDAAGPATDPVAPISPGKINDALFDRAVLAETNQMRARHGVAQLKADESLTRAAFVHAHNMARLRTYSHELPVRGQASLVERLKAASVPFRLAGENIAMQKVYRIVEAPISEKFEGCAFTRAGSGAPVPIHSYESLAKAAVAQWMASSRHRESLLNPNFRRVGAAFAIDPAGPACGDIYIAQNFVG